MIDRRRLLASVAAGTLGALAAPSARSARAGAAPVVLTAGRRTLEVNGRSATMFGITQPDGTQGLFTEVGTPFRVTLRNGAGADTLIHWHGMTPPYRQDGVPGISGPPIVPGGAAQYDFPLTFPGTFWMHSHQGLQEQALMSAPLIIRERGGSADRQEVVVMLHDFSFKPPAEIYAGLRRVPSSFAGRSKDRMAGMAATDMHGTARDLNDVSYDAFLANDRTLADPEVVRVERRGRVLLRIINASAASNFRIDLGQVRARLVAVDGRPVRTLTGSTFPIAIAQRLDLEARMPAGEPFLPVLAVLEGERARTGIVLATPSGTVPKISDQAPGAAAPLTFAMERTLIAAAPLSPRPADRVHRVDLTGTMEGYVWGLNGRTYGHDTPLMVAKGERVELLMSNRTRMSHPMHLHGHPFQVVAFNGRRFSGAVRDTVLVPPMQSVTIAFDADNPGRWAFHCHNLYHMKAGMMTTVQYEAF